MKITPIHQNIKPYDYTISKRQNLVNMPQLVSIPNFYIPTLINFKGKPEDFRKDLEKKFLKGDEEELFIFLDKSFRDRANEKKISNNAFDEVVQNAMLNCLILIKNYENKNVSDSDNLFNEINQIYINLKAKQSDYPSSLWIKSLNERTWWNKEPLIDSLTEDDSAKLSYAIDKEKIRLQRIKIRNAISAAELSDKEKTLLDKRYRQDKIKTCEEIAKLYNISRERVRLILKSTILKIQIANNCVPDDVENYIDTFSKTFNLNKETSQKIIIKDCQLLSKPPLDLRDNVQNFIDKHKANGLTMENYISACIKQPQLFYRNSKSIEKNITDLVDKFKFNGLTFDSYFQCCLKMPTLFCCSPNTIEKNVLDLVDKFQNYGLKTDDYVKACIKAPSLFYQSPNTIEKNVLNLVDKFKDNDLTINEYLKCCIKKPQLFYESPNTIEKNVLDLVDKFKDNGLTINEYLKCCIKYPQLFQQTPETVSDNINILVKKFQNYGLKTDDYVKACIKAPSLFYQSPNTIEKNVLNLVDKFKDNDLTINEYLKCCIKKPQLFHQSPNTIEKNVVDLANRFKSSNLTDSSYLRCCVKKPQLFYQSPDTIEQNVREVVNRYKHNGLILDDYIKACKTQPQLFCQSPNTISEHIDILRFCNKNFDKSLANNEFWQHYVKNPVNLCFSSSLIFIQNLIIPKMFENSKIPKELKGSGQREKLNDYLKSHPNDKYVLEIKNMKSDTDCMKILNETLDKIMEDAGVSKDTFLIKEIN